MLRGIIARGKLIAAAPLARRHFTILDSTTEGGNRCLSVTDVWDRQPGELYGERVFDGRSNGTLEAEITFPRQEGCCRMPRVLSTSHLQGHLACSAREVTARTIRKALDVSFVENHRPRGYILDDQARLRQQFVNEKRISDCERRGDTVFDGSEIVVLRALSAGWPKILPNGADCRNRHGMHERLHVGTPKGLVNLECETGSGQIAPVDFLDEPTTVFPQDPRHGGLVTTAVTTGPAPATRSLRSVACVSSRHGPAQLGTNS